MFLDGWASHNLTFAALFSGAKLPLGLLSVVFDILFMTQHFILYTGREEPELLSSIRECYGDECTGCFGRCNRKRRPWEAAAKDRTLTYETESSSSELSESTDTETTNLLAGPDPYRPLWAQRGDTNCPCGEPITHY